MKTLILSFALLLGCTAMAQNNSEADSLKVYRDMALVDEMAEFPGNVYKWLGEHIVYPDGCKKNGIEGRVSAQFIIEKDGSIVDIKVLRSPDELLSQEVVRVIKEMPKWKPAQIKGKPVKMSYVLPVMFRLPKETKSEGAAPTNN